MKKAQESLSRMRAASALGLLLLTGLLSSHALADRDDQQRPDRQLTRDAGRGVQQGPGWQVQLDQGRSVHPGPVSPPRHDYRGGESRRIERVERSGDYYRSPSWQLDMRFQHDRYYPRHGNIVNALPPGYRDFRFRGSHYYFQGGVWFRGVGPNFVITAPPFGIVIPFLPPDYTTLWLDSVPYYYANDVYYTPYPSGPGYVVVDPPANIDSAVVGPPAAAVPPTAAIYPPPPPPPLVQSSETAIKVVPSPPEPAANTNSEPMFVYPAKGQSISRMNKDRTQCAKQATGQTNYDPASGVGDTLQRDDYQRAVKTCLEERGYTVQ